MTTHKLVVEYDEDFEVIGLVSSVKEYKLAWSINQLLGFKFKKGKDICLPLDKTHIYISNYLYETENTAVWLLKNKGYSEDGEERPYLLPEVKWYDFIMKFDSPAEDWNIASLTKNMQSLSIVELVQEIDKEAIKSKENLIF